MHKSKSSKFKGQTISTSNRINLGRGKIQFTYLIYFLTLLFFRYFSSTKKLSWPPRPHGWNQGIIWGRKCRLSTETPDYQLGWPVLAASRLLDTLKCNFMYWKFSQPYILQNINWVHSINGQSTVPPLHSSLYVVPIWYYIIRYIDFITLKRAWLI